MKKRLIVPSVLILATLGQGCATAPPKPAPAPANGEASAANVCNIAKLADAIMTEKNEGLLFPGILPSEETADKNIRIKTAKGDIIFELLPQEGPCAASNFVYLTSKGFYDGLIFHRQEPWVIQGGDPLGQGFGGPGYKFKDDKVNLPYDRGIVAMANAGPNTNGSQFFIIVEDTPLPPNYSIFGRVIEGMEVVDKIRVGDVMENVTIEGRVKADAMTPTSTVSDAAPE